MSEIQSLARGLKILDLLGQSEDGLSVTELAASLGVDKGSASPWSPPWRYGYAEKDELTRRYQLGPQVVSLSRSLLAHLPLRVRSAILKNWRDNGVESYNHRRCA